MNATHPAAKFLRQHRWRARGTLLVWSLLVTLAAAAFQGAIRLGWTTRGIEWSLLPIAAAAVLLGLWFRRVQHLTPRRLAHELDTRWGLRSRLETAVELAGNDSPLARSQRDDATEKLAGKKPPGAFLWFLGLFAVAVIFSVVSFEGAALAWRALQKPPPKAVVAETAAATPNTPPAPPEFHAAIEWKSPESEIKATAIEEVPLVATAESNTGFRSVTLELDVNGSRKVSKPLEPSAISAGATPGSYEFKPSLYLDELEVKVGDMVSYRLIGELDAPEKQLVTSELQFVEIRATQRDRMLRGGEISPIAALIIDLKSRQLAALKENYSLAQLASDRPDAAWLVENKRVATEQESIASGAGELLKLIRAEPRMPPAIVDKAKDLESVTHDAAKDIAAKANDRAMQPQSRALAILTDLSTMIREAMSGPTAPISDPVADRQTFKLPPRSETPAGELEQLAERQQKNNTRINQPANNGSAGNPARTDDAKAEQAAIARDAEKLAAGGQVSPEAQGAVGNGAGAAGGAARHLAANDPASARVPGAAAQRAFEEAVEAQDKAGRATAAAELEQLRRTLNAASRASAGERAQQLTKVRDELRRAATDQQRTGSADAARDLAQLAQLADIRNPTPAQTREVAASAAQLQVGLMPRNAAVNRAVRLLNRSGSSATGDAALRDIELASQEAQWLGRTPATIELAQKVAGQADSLQHSGAGSGGAASSDAAAGATKLAVALEQERGNHEGMGRRFNPADVDPAYRTAVETYFERLSRDARPAPQPAGK